ncbi:MAG: MspI family type II restriction endonuclease [Agathobacter sp.]|nr:MspI family type II restriction endonuclease [Agathobacter sp.]
MGENKDKNEHGQNARKALKEMLVSMRTHDFLANVEENYAIYDRDFPKKDQFKAPYMIEFKDEEQWILFSTTSIRDRMKQQEWDASNIKRLNEKVKKAYVVVPDGIQKSELENAEKYNKEIKEGKRYSVLDGVETLEITAGLIQHKGSPLLAYGSGIAKMGNEFEEKIAAVLSNRQNLLKWKGVSKNNDGYFYPLFLQIVNKWGLESDKVTKISTTTKVPSLATRGKAKTDVIVYVEIDSVDEIVYTISCKRTEKSIVSVHEYSAERYATILNPEDKELEQLLKEFRDAGGINAYKKTNELTEKMRIYGDALARWGVGGYGDPKVTQPELQCADYIITFDAIANRYSIHELNEYIDLCKQDEKNGGHFGTIFRWTKKKDNIQLKMKLI